MEYLYTDLSHSKKQSPDGKVQVPISATLDYFLKK